MKIKDSLPQFNNKRALIIVTGREYAEFYLASNGEVATLEKIETEKRSPAEVVDKFKTRTSGYIVSGADEEETKRETREFLSMFEEKFPDILRVATPELIYLFSPSYISQEILHRIPKSKINTVAAHFDGNYRDKHLFDLLQMIQTDMKSNGVEPKSAEAQKIYDKFPESEA